MTRALLPLLLVGLLASGCGSDTAHVEYDVDKTGGSTTYEAQAPAAPEASDALIGSWTHSTYISPQEVARLSEDPIPPGVEVDMTVSGSNTYHLGGRYDSDAEITIHVRADGQDIPLKMLRRDAGTWKVVGDVLIETVTSGSATALDAQTEDFLAEAPEFRAFLTPIPGETQSSNLESVSNSAIDLQEQTSQLRLTLRRKG